MKWLIIISFLKKSIGKCRVVNTCGCVALKANFGPLACVEVELTPLTAFAGPTNIGNTWSATLVYAFIGYRMAFHGFLLGNSISPDKTEKRM